MLPRALLAAALCAALRVGAQSPPAQSPCADTPAYSTCDMVFELNDAEVAAHPRPYLTVDLRAEFRSPHFKTYLLPAFWDGGRRMVIRFAPTEAGDWIYRLSGNLTRLEGQQGGFTAKSSNAPGFVIPANLHHWAYTELNPIGGNIPHLWMGDTCLRFAFLDDATFRRIADARAAQKFNHMRGLALGTAQDSAAAYAGPDEPKPDYFHRLDDRIRYLNGKGITVDLILGAARNQLAKMFPTWQQRERYVRYMVSRYSPMNITWQGLEEFETYDNGRALLKELGDLLKKTDPYGHPRTTDTGTTSGPVQDDGWQNFVAYRTADDQVGAVEHQIYGTPFVNLDFGREDSGAGKSTPDDVDADTFRHRLWNATMDGQYVTFNNTGTAGGKIPVDARYADSPGAKLMTAWYDFFAHTRHWELEPYFDVDGGRAVAEEGIEYIIYIEKPSAPIEVEVDKHRYDVIWFNPASGESTRQKKDFNGEHFTGSPPDNTHDWVLHLSRESHKEGMLRSVKFESREMPLSLQEVEINPVKVPFEIERPAAGSSIPISMGAPYSVKIKRETRATRAMMYLWLGEVAASGQGYRVIATGAKGTFRIPPDITRELPADLTVRLFGMNANGKVYAVNTAYSLTK